MRVKSLLSTTVVWGMMALPASATMRVTQTITPGTGELSGFDIHRYFAGFDPVTSDEAIAGANGLEAVKVTFSTGHTTYFKFKFTDLDHDGENDADVTGATISDSVARTDTATVGTMIRVNPVDSFSVQQVFPTGSRSDTNLDGTPDTIPTSNYSATTTFRLEGFSQDPPAGPGYDASAKSTGPGALFGIAVVPTGTVVSAFGSLAPDKGYVTSFDGPEPATLGLISVGAIGLLARRRRKA
jgi:hypothetical protein